MKKNYTISKPDTSYHDLKLQLYDVIYYNPIQYFLSHGHDHEEALELLKIPEHMIYYNRLELLLESLQWTMEKRIAREFSIRSSSKYLGETKDLIADYKGEVCIRGFRLHRITKEEIDSGLREGEKLTANDLQFFICTDFRNHLLDQLKAQNSRKDQYEDMQEELQEDFRPFIRHSFTKKHGGYDYDQKELSIYLRVNPSTITRWHQNGLKHYPEPSFNGYYAKDLRSFLKTLGNKGIKHLTKLDTNLSSKASKATPEKEREDNLKAETQAAYENRLIESAEKEDLPIEVDTQPSEPILPSYRKCITCADLKENDEFEHSGACSCYSCDNVIQALNEHGMSQSHRKIVVGSYPEFCIYYRATPEQKLLIEDYKREDKLRRKYIHNGAKQLGYGNLAFLLTQLIALKPVFS